MRSVPFVVVVVVVVKKDELENNDSPTSVKLYAGYVRTSYK
jgi:hypothetical protein